MSTNGEPLRVLVIDDEPLHAEAVAESLQRVGYECVVATSGSAGAKKIDQEDFDVVLTPTLAQVPRPVGGLRNDDDPAAEFTAMAAFTPFTGAYNVSGQERENTEVVRRILDLTGASADLVRHVQDRPGHDRRYSVDSTKLRGLGWTPQRPAGRALERNEAAIGRWQRQRWPELKKTPKDGGKRSSSSTKAD